MTKGATFKNMSLVTLEEAKEVSQKLVAELNPQAIILFGSIARTGQGNDLDLLIIKKDDAKSKWESYQEVTHTLDEFFKRFSIDYFVLSDSKAKELFLQGSPFLRLIQREGKSLYMKDSIQEWLQKAKEDLAMAHYLYQGSYYQGTCYHAQQALEKAMKGLLLKEGWNLEKIHFIRRLINYGKGFHLNFDIPDDMVTLIDSIYEGRYPGEEGLLHTGEPTQEQANLILSTVDTFFQKQKFS